jgi:fluoride exporter
LLLHPGALTVSSGSAPSRRVPEGCRSEGKRRIIDEVADPAAEEQNADVDAGRGDRDVCALLVEPMVGGQPWAQSFPSGTFVINVTGSFILGAAAVFILERLSPAHQDLYLLIGTGFCGGYTTFSTFEWETFKLIRDGSWLYAFANVFGSVVAGFLGVLLGVILADLFFMWMLSARNS